jgi:hypothetical protein
LAIEDNYEKPLQHWKEKSRKIHLLSGGVEQSSENPAPRVIKLNIYYEWLFLV